MILAQSTTSSTKECSDTTMIRQATIHDIPRIREIINGHAELGKMLFKNYAQLYEDLRDFGVAEIDGRVVGCAAVAIIWADLAEIRSLAVDDAHRGRGIGRRPEGHASAEGLERLRPLPQARGLRRDRRRPRAAGCPHDRHAHRHALAEGDEHSGAGVR
jgi:GNAT superfamily N-acetyltransferase